MAGVLAIIFILAVVYWGGVVRGPKLPAFLLGIAVLIATLGAFAFAFWHLLVCPLPARQRVIASQNINATYRQAMALLLGIASINIVVGGFWDEVWHRLYGLPFSEDFFWRPHLLMYFGFLSVMALGAVGLYMIVRQLQGTLQQRFRAVPTLGLLILLAAFMMYALPADPAWHQIYGSDLTAWSIPHLLLMLNFTTIMLVAVAIQLTMVPVREWRTLASITFYDILPLLMFASILLINLQLFTTEYDQVGAYDNPMMRARPEWVLPFLIAGVASFVGVLANHSLRYVGAATISGLLALALRYGLIQAFDAEIVRASGWTVALLPLLAIDLWYGTCLLRKRTPAWSGGGIAATAGMVAAYPLMTQLYPEMAINNLVMMGAMMLLAGLCASWLGARIGDYLATSNKQVRRSGVPVAVPLVSIGALVALAGFILFYINTATPPQ